MNTVLSLHPLLRNTFFLITMFSAYICYFLCKFLIQIVQYCTATRPKKNIKIINITDRIGVYVQAKNKIYTAIFFFYL